MTKMTARIKEAIAEAIDSTAHLDAALAAQAIAKKLGLNDRLVNYTHIEARNKLNEYGYKATPFSERILFLPHCLRDSRHCKAKSTEEGLQCRHCGKCEISELIGISKELGYANAFVVPGGSLVQKLVRKHKPKATVGICCYHEANLAFDALKGTKIHPQVVLLLQDGCKDTKANIAEVREKMEMIDNRILGKNGRLK